MSALTAMETPMYLCVVLQREKSKQSGASFFSPPTAVLTLA